MSSEKSLAIVLRLIDFSETSVVATLFTAEFGKISALAKGARRPKGPFEAALDLLAVCRIVFIRKSSDALDLLTEAKLERRFRAASRDLSRLYAGYYVAELLRDLTDTGDPHPELFGAAEQSLKQLDEIGDVLTTVLRFELTALRLLGHLPLLDRCAGCGDVVQETKRVAFGLLSGGLLCPQCRRGKRQVVSVSCEALEALKRLSTEAWGATETNAGPPLPHGELRGLLNRYLANLVGHPLRMHAYLQQVK